MCRSIRTIRLAAMKAEATDWPHFTIKDMFLHVSELAGLCIAGAQGNVAVRLLAAGLAATALVVAPSIAEAKVVLEQPKVKKVRPVTQLLCRAEHAMLCCA